QAGKPMLEAHSPAYCRGYLAAGGRNMKDAEQREMFRPFGERISERFDSLDHKISDAVITSDRETKERVRSLEQLPTHIDGKTIERLAAMLVVSSLVSGAAIFAAGMALAAWLMR